MDHTLPPRRSPTPCPLNTLGAEVVHSGLFFCSSQAGRVVQTRGAPHQPTLCIIPRWFAGSAAHLDHTLPPRSSPTPCLLNTVGAEVVHRGSFFVPQAGRVVQTRGAQRQPKLFTIPRWLAGGAAHLDHNLPPRRSPTPCLLNTLGAEVVHSGLFFVPPRPGAWSKRAAPHTNPHYLLFRAGWRGAPPIWTTPCRREGLPHPVR